MFLALALLHSLSASAVCEGEERRGEERRGVERGFISVMRFWPLGAARVNWPSHSPSSTTTIDPWSAPAALGYLGYRKEVVSSSNGKHRDKWKELELRDTTI